jgi:hypothetical protein
MSEDVMTLYWRAGSVSVRSWFDYAVDGSGVSYYGAECDCDAWDVHLQRPPTEPVTTARVSRTTNEPSATETRT